MKVTGLPHMLVRAHCVSRLAGLGRGMLHCHADSLTAPLRGGLGLARPSYLFLQACTRCRATPFATAHPRTFGQLTKDEHDTLLAEVRDQASPAAEGVPPPLLALQEKTSARSLHRVAAIICRTTLVEFQGNGDSAVQARLQAREDLVDPSDETEQAAPMPSQVDERRRNYKEHGEPLPNFDPSPEQTAAKSARIPLEPNSLLTPVWQMFSEKAPPSISCKRTGRTCPWKFIGRPRWKRGSRAGACTKPSRSCSVWTTTIRTHVSPLRLRSRPVVREFPEA